jgi:ribosomal protein S27AE
LAQNLKGVAAQTTTDGARWWKTGEAEVDKLPHLRSGHSCPKCYLADLEFDTLFRLHCPNCGYVAECGAFT